MKDKNNEKVKEIFDSEKRAFIFWSWIGLLAAFLITIALYATQLFTILTKGMLSIEVGQYKYIQSIFLFIPGIFLILGLVTFFSYSMQIFKITILEFVIAYDRRKTYLRFRFSLFYLISTWIFMLITLVLPFIINFFYQFYI